MKTIRLVLGVAAAGLVLLAVRQVGWAQTISLTPNQVPNGVAPSSGAQFHQRFDMTLGGTAVAQSRMFTITVASELTVVANSVTATSNSSNLVAYYAGSSSSSLRTLNFGLTGTASSQTLTIECDVTTPANFAGVADGGKVDTVYTIDFTAGSNQSDKRITVSKHQNRRLRLIPFAAPDSTQGDTTVGGGRFFKLAFSSVLPDLSHTGISGLSASAGRSDSRTDVVYSFYVATDSTLIKRSAEPRAAFYTLGPDRTPLVGSRQNPRFVPGTFVREDFTTRFSASAADTLNGVISLENTSDNAIYYVYVLADPAPDRLPFARLTYGGSAKKGYDASGRGEFTGGAFLGRSGPLLVRHPPEFVAVGWDYDDDGGDDYSTTGRIQVPSDIPGMAAVAANRKDNRNIIVDTGTFVSKGDAISSLNNGNSPSAVSAVDLLFKAQDADNSASFRMNIFLSRQSGLGVGSLVGAGIDSLSGGIRVAGTDTLTIDNAILSFSPAVRDATTNLVTSYVPEGDYFVYFVATDGDDDHRVVTQVMDDPFIANPTAAVLSVRHSPNLTLDAFSLNDFQGDGDLDVVTGIDASQMQTDLDGKDLSPGPAQRQVTLSWGGSGMDGDVDVDNNAEIVFYYSTRSDFKSAGGSASYTSGNSDGSDLLAAIDQENTDTHRINAEAVREDPDGMFDNQVAWDLWTYVSSENTIPMTGTHYYIYAMMKGGTTRRLVSLTSSGAIQFQHPPFIRPVMPVQDLSVTVDEPVVVSWEAVDVDNAEAKGIAGPATGAVGKGRIAPNSRTDSPNVRILLTSADFGEVTTWGSITNSRQAHRFWVGNSGDGSLAGEVELNEGVDTSFVILGNRMRNNLGGGASSGGLELQTNSGLGVTYYVYLAIDSGTDGTVADKPTNFSAFSPVVRAPGKITVTGMVQTNPLTSPRFIVPNRMVAVANETFKYPIVLDDGDASGRIVKLVDIFVTVDADEFEAVDQDPTTAGVQPFSLPGDNAQINSGNVDQAALFQGDKLWLDFIYDDQTSGLTFFDGIQPLVFLNLKAKSLSGGGVVSTTISLDNSGTRVSKMLDVSLTKISAAMPSPTQVDIVQRSRISGTVPLQGRSVSADTVTFFLRHIGGLTGVSDSLFNLNDIDATRAGVQVVTTGVDGAFTLANAPSGRWVLAAWAQRHLAGHDTVDVRPGQDLDGVQPTLDGDGVDRAALLAGDAAGYTDSTGASVPDNFIDSADLNAINAALFEQLGEANYNAFADINRDSVVNATDKDYAAAYQTSNSGQANKIKPVFPTFKAVAPEGDNANAVVALSDLPGGEVRPGERFDVTVKVTGARAVRTYEVHLTYDPAKLVVEDVVSWGDFLERYLTDPAARAWQVDDRAEVGLVNSIMGRTALGASGDGTLAVVRFRVVGRAAQTRLTLIDAMLIDVDHAGVRPKLNGEATLTLSKDPILYHDADGNPIRGLLLADADPKVDFNDFLLLAGAFGWQTGDTGYDLRADLNADDRVDFADFLLFSKDFGKVAVDAPSS